MRCKQVWIAVLALTAWCGSTMTLKAESTISKAQREKAKESIRELSDELNRLQEDIIEDMEGKERFSLYGRVDRLEGNLDSLRRKLASQSGRVEIYKAFDKIDTEIHALMQVGRDANFRSIRQSAKRVYFADLELHYVLSLGDTSPGRRLDVLQRQAKAFAQTTDQIQSTIVLALKAKVPAGVDKLAQHAKKFEKMVSKLTVIDPAKREFAALNRQWILLTKELAKLPPRQNRYLLRTAVRLDTLHKRLFELLKMPGERQVLTIQI